MESISSSKSAFITALYVPLVPLLQWAVMRRRPHPMAWVGIALAFCGLVLLAGPDGPSLGLGRGELLTLVATVAIAAEILLVGTFAGSVDVRRVSIVQLSVASLLCFAFIPVTGEALRPIGWGVLAAAAGLGFASALIQVTMNWAQKRVEPTRATLIYAGESVWAGIVAGCGGSSPRPRHGRSRAHRARRDRQRTAPQEKIRFLRRKSHSIRCGGRSPARRFPVPAR